MITAKEAKEIAQLTYKVNKMNYRADATILISEWLHSDGRQSAKVIQFLIESLANDIEWVKDNIREKDKILLVEVNSYINGNQLNK